MKCVACHRTADAEPAIYARVASDGRIKAVREYPCCQACHLESLHTSRVTAVLRQLYEAESLN